MYLLPIVFRPVFLEFLTGIDAYLSRDVHVTHGNVGEIPTTVNLLRSLDLRQSAAAPAGLRVTAVEFQDKLLALAAQLDIPRRISFSIAAEGFDQLFEGKVSQSDYALHLRFDDTSNDIPFGQDHSWSAYYFLQSKIARTPGESSKRYNRPWGPDARFTQNRLQKDCIEFVRTLVGSKALRYNLYCPINALSHVPKDQVLRKLRDFNSQYKDDWEYLEKAGLWITQSQPNTLGDLLKYDENETTYPWALFISDHYFSERHQYIDLNDVFFDKDTHREPEAAERRGLFERQESIIKRIREGIEKIREPKRSKQHKKLSALRQFTKQGYRPTITIDIAFPGYDHVHRFGKVDTPRVK